MPHNDDSTNELPQISSAHSRRTFIGSAATLLALGAAAPSVATGAQAAAASPAATVTAAASPFAATAFAEMHKPRPLKFDSTRLRGISKALIESHWANNYGSAVRTLNAVKLKLAAANGDANTPPYLYNDLKREHLVRSGSVVLHDLYFENLGGSGHAGADARSLIAASFGSFDVWETEFRRIATGLGGGSGWVMLAFNPHFRTLENYWLADHLHGAATSVPLLVLDMYEHAYQMDYGAAAAKYIDAAFTNFDWEVVMARAGVIGRAPSA